MAAYNKFNQFVEDLGLGEHVLSAAGDVLRVWLREHDIWLEDRPDGTCRWYFVGWWRALFPGPMLGHTSGVIAPGS